MHTALGHRARFAVLGATNLTSCYRTACCVCVFDRGGGSLIKGAGAEIWRGKVPERRSGGIRPNLLLLLL